MPTTRPALPSSASSSRSRRSPTVRSPRRRQVRRRSTRSWSPPPATTGRPALPTAASAAREVRPRRSPQARSTRDAGARPVTSSCSPGFVSSSPASSRSEASSLPPSRCRHRSLRSRRLRPRSSVRRAASRASSTRAASAASRGSAVLLPRGTSSPEAVREVVAAGARAVLVDGPLPAGSLGTDGPADVPILGLAPADADAVRASLRHSIPVAIRGRSRGVRRERRPRRVRRRSRPRGSHSTAGRSPR